MLKVAGNPLHCDADLAWLKTNTHLNIDIGDSPCACPAHLHNQSWGDIIEQDLLWSLTTRDSCEAYEQVAVTTRDVTTPTHTPTHAAATATGARRQVLSLVEQAQLRYDEADARVSATARRTGPTEASGAEVVGAFAIIFVSCEIAFFLLLDGRHIAPWLTHWRNQWLLRRRRHVWV